MPFLQPHAAPALLCLCLAAAMVRVAGAMQRSTEVMREVNAVIRAPELSRVMMEMGKEMMKVRPHDPRVAMACRPAQPCKPRRRACIQSFVRRRCICICTCTCMQAGLIDEMISDAIDDAIGAEDEEEETDAEVGVRPACLPAAHLPACCPPACLPAGPPAWCCVPWAYGVCDTARVPLPEGSCGFLWPCLQVARVLAEIAGETAAALPNAQVRAGWGACAPWGACARTPHTQKRCVHAGRSEGGNEPALRFCAAHQKAERRHTAALL